jgi:carbon storage regulator CsrA
MAGALEDLPPHERNREMALTLTRKIGESVVVNENVTINVRRVAGNRVTLTIDAPLHVKILRKELIDGEGRHGKEPESHAA